MSNNFNETKKTIWEKSYVHIFFNWLIVYLNIYDFESNDWNPLILGPDWT